MRTDLLPGLVLVAILAGCSSSNGTLPTAPSTPAAPVPAPASGRGQGTISIRQLSPGPGATLAVDAECSAGSVTRVCSETWQGTFDVLIEEDLPYAVLTVGFFSDQTLCAYGANTRDVIRAGSQVSIAVHRIYLSDEFGTFARPCQRPATTNRMEVHLWSDSNWTNNLVQHFEGTYTFSDR